MKTYLSELNTALHDCCRKDNSIYVFGEDIVDPYGGAFKVTKGLSSTFPGRVLSTPISEAALIGMAGGMALRGLRPVVEIMFGDFLLLCMDQIVNYVTKFKYMYGQMDLKVPIVIRTPMGGGRGYGPTHSQCLEKYFFGIPGLKVISPSIFHDVASLLSSAIEDDEPVLFVEYKKLYSKKILPATDLDIQIQNLKNEKNNSFPMVEISSLGTEKFDVLILTYGGVSGSLLELMASLLGEEITAACLVPSMLNEFDFHTIHQYMERTKYGCLIVEENVEKFNWGSELIAGLSERFPFSIPVRRIAVESPVMPASKPAEKELIPGIDHILNAVYEFLKSGITNEVS